MRNEKLKTKKSLAVKFDERDEKDKNFVVELFGPEGFSLFPDRF